MECASIHGLDGPLGVCAGVGIEEILEAVVARVPPPQDRSDNAPRALIFDSFYDQYLGIVCQFRVKDGVFTKQDTVQFMNTGRSHAVTDMWIRAPDRVDVASLSAGEVGCLAGAMKTVQVRSAPSECEMGMYVLGLYVLGRFGSHTVCEFREHAGCASGGHYHSARGAGQ